MLSRLQFLFLLTFLLLCTNASAVNFTAEGKMGFYENKKGGSASFSWQQKSGQYAIHLSGPFASKSMVIFGKPGEVMLKTSEGETFTAKTPEQLVYRVSGFKLPVSFLQYWLLGLYAPGQKPSHMTFNENKTINTMVQEGWTIRYKSYTGIKGVFLPSHLQITKGNLRLNVIIKKWHLE